MAIDVVYAPINTWHCNTIRDYSNLALELDQGLMLLTETIIETKTRYLQLRVNDGVNDA